MPPVKPLNAAKSVGPSLSPRMNITRVSPARREPTRKLQTSMSLPAQFLNKLIQRSFRGEAVLTTSPLRNKRRWYRPIHPHSPMMKHWDLLSVILIIFTAVVTPFETAFATTTINSPLFYINRLVDFCFFVDAVLHFFVMYYDEPANIWVTDPQRIGKKYLTGWFMLDVVSMLPFDVVGLAVDNATVKQLRFTRVLRLLRLVKILKIMKGANNFRVWESKIGVRYATIALIKFCLLVLMTAHWMACIFRMIADIEDFMDPLGFRYNWMTEHQMGRIPISRSSITIQYMSAFYWSVMTLTTIGYGDLVPTTPGERSLAIMCMLIGGGIYAYVVGSVCQILNSMDASTTEFHQTIDTLNEYCRHNQLPSELSSRLREYFHSSRTLLREKQHHDLLLTMSPGLRGEVALYNNQWISKIQFFNCNNELERSQFITAVALVLRPECFPPNEYVIREGEFNTKMYLVQRGLATKGNVMYSGGSFFGEDIILTLRQRKSSVRAFSYLHLQALSKFELEELIYSGLYPEIQRNIRRQVLKTAFKNNFVKFSQDTMRRRSTKYNPRNSIKMQHPFSPLMVPTNWQSSLLTNNHPLQNPLLRSPLHHPGLYRDLTPPIEPQKSIKDDEAVDTIVDSVTNALETNISKHNEQLSKKIDDVVAQLKRLEKYIAPNIIFGPFKPPQQELKEAEKEPSLSSALHLQAVIQLERGETRTLTRAGSFTSRRRRSSLGL